MNLILISLILLLAKGVRLNECDQLVDENNVTVHFEEECGGPRSKPCVIRCCGPNEAIDKRPGENLLLCKSISKFREEKDLSSIESDLKSYSGIQIVTELNTTKFSTKTLASDFRILYRRYSYGSKQCPNSAFETKKKTHKMTENGEIDFDNVGVITPSMFCYEIMIGQHKDTKKTVVAYLYSLNYKNIEHDTKTRFFGYSSLISAIFLLATLVVYGLLKDLRNKLYGMMMMMFIVSLMCLTAITAYSRFHELTLRNEDRTGEISKNCYWLSPIVFYITFSTFFWINAISIDIWWTFRYAPTGYNYPEYLQFDLLLEWDELSDAGKDRRSRQNHNFIRKFLWYALYAWGMPALLTAITLFMDSKHAPAGVIKPGFANCFYSFTTKFVSPRIYHTLPSVIVIAANTVMYVLTIYNIWVVESFSGFLKKSNKNNNKFFVYIRLATIMGVNWIIELAQEFQPDNLSLPAYLMLNAYTSFIGVMVFLILVAKKSIFIKLCIRFGIENRWTRSYTQVKSTTRTDYSKSKTKANNDASNADTLKIEDHPTP